MLWLRHPQLQKDLPGLLQMPPTHSPEFDGFLLISGRWRGGQRPSQHSWSLGEWRWSRCPVSVGGLLASPGLFSPPPALSGSIIVIAGRASVGWSQGPLPLGCPACFACFAFASRAGRLLLLLSVVGFSFRLRLPLPGGWGLAPARLVLVGRRPLVGAVDSWVCFSSFG